GVRILSRPSRRLYAGYKDIRPIRQGYGMLVLSTPKGVMDGKSAKMQKLGGQLLFEIW
ncbi:MAG: 30S ribosomal protein S8, partial [Patescibacteria group bacterium]|nr:30S ribosomal protein S8 [Patescibacteria group bacterium]